MSFTASPIFISYSRSDGRQFAEAFSRRLEAEGIHTWRDLKSMGAGDIRPQVLRAIEGTKHLVLILSRRALVSDWIKREWSHARLTGKQVSPVLADPTLTRADLPAWIKREEVFDIEPARDRGEERWKALVLGLLGDGRVKRAPFMPGDLPADFVPRPAETDALKAAVLGQTPGMAVGGTVALTTALLGAGGYGKTTLAGALCRDPDVRFEFSDGILRVEIGKERNDVTGLVSDLIEKLDPDGKRPGFADVATASEHLGELLGESRILMVIDDVWREAQLKPFLRGGANCVRLVTTRLPGLLPHGSISVPIDEMRAAEATGLIGAGLVGAKAPPIAIRLAALAKRLGYWAQMLAIANGWLRDRVARGEGLPEAITRFERRLAKDGPFVFDPRKELQRNRAIRLCIEASVEDLDSGEAARFADLAVLPEDEDVPLGIIAALWAETGGLSEDEADDLVNRLDKLSLVQSLDLARRTLRLHDNVLWYLRDRLGADGLRAAHAAMIKALRGDCSGGWSALLPSQTYGWRHLIAHLRGAGDDHAADDLLSDYWWIKARLHATDGRSLYGSYLPESANADVRQIGRAIGLSLSALMEEESALAGQLFGRLGDTAFPCATEARLDPDCRPRSRWPSLTPPGAERLRLEGHQAEVNSAAFSPDGARIVTASDDKTARLWDAITGIELAVLREHESAVNSATFSPDGARIVTASRDTTARIWEAASFAEVATLRGHGNGLSGVAFSPDGASIATASFDSTARVWDANTGAAGAVLDGHKNVVYSAAFSPDGARIVTGSGDGTAWIWDAVTGAVIAVLSGHESSVNDAAFSPDGARIVTASDDKTARIWDATTGAQIVVLCGHEDWVYSAAFSPNGARIVTASRDESSRLWDSATGAEIVSLRGHENRVEGAAFSPDGSSIVTASWDWTARIWDADAGISARRRHENRVVSVDFSPDGTCIATASGQVPRTWDACTGAEIFALRGHDNWVVGAAYSPDGAQIVTASWDGTARIWDAATGFEVAALRHNGKAVNSAAFSPNGARIVTASDDRTARLWDATTGAEIAVMRGHENSLFSAVFAPGGAQIVTACWDNTARVWDAVSGARIATLYGHKDRVLSAAFSPECARVVTASLDRTARLWDAASGREIAILRGHQAMVLNGVFSPAGRCVVTASSDTTARIWDAATGKQINVLRGHSGMVRKAVFSSDGARIVTASEDRTARVWDAASGGEIARLRLDAAVIAIAIHGTAIALGDALGRIHVFDAEDFLG